MLQRRNIKYETSFSVSDMANNVLISRHIMDQIRAGKMNPFTSLHCKSICSSISFSLNHPNYRWYNTPPSPSKKQKTSHPSSPTVTPGLSLTAFVEEGAGPETPPESDSKPIDFNTFVPTHDAGLSLPPVSSASGSDPSAYAAASTTLSAQPGQTVSQDEAFKRALEATYWSGYWTAVYHVCSLIPFLNTQF